MSGLREYRRRDNTLISAAQLALDMDGLTYRKWGGVQTAGPGDWLVNREGEAYTIDREVFKRTYSMVSPGLYQKVTSVWARAAESDGVIPTKEGETHYAAGDMIVFNDPEGQDGYAMSSETFSKLYVACEEDAGT